MQMPLNLIGGVGADRPATGCPEAAAPAHRLYLWHVASAAVAMVNAAAN